MTPRTARADPSPSPNPDPNPNPNPDPNPTPQSAPGALLCRTPADAALAPAGALPVSVALNAEHFTAQQAPAWVMVRVRARATATARG